jgi:hypothetical protein
MSPEHTVSAHFRKRIEEYVHASCHHNISWDRPGPRGGGRLDNSNYKVKGPFCLVGSPAGAYMPAWQLKKPAAPAARTRCARKPRRPKTRSEPSGRTPPPRGAPADTVDGPSLAPVRSTSCGGAGQRLGGRRVRREEGRVVCGVFVRLLAFVGNFEPSFY